MCFGFLVDAVSFLNKIVPASIFLDEMSNLQLKF